MEWLRPTAGATYVDGTLGLGGHTERILELTNGRARVLGTEWDEDAADRAGPRLAKWGEAIEVVRESYANLPAILEKRNIRGVDGILLDLGVSSLQLDDSSRGFSFQSDAPLDMRMSGKLRQTAAGILQTFGERELEKILREFGEERYARRIAKAIGRMRGKRQPDRPGGKTPEGDVLESTRALAEFIERLLGRRGRTHPATRVFQALRIAVNDELGNLQKFLSVVDDLLGVSGRVLIISFHSLEDRLVKQAFREKDRLGKLKILTRKPVIPSEEEVRRNPRSRSAKLRVAERKSDSTSANDSGRSGAA